MEGCSLYMYTAIKFQTISCIGDFAESLQNYEELCLFHAGASSGRSNHCNLVQDIFFIC